MLNRETSIRSKGRNGLTVVSSDKLTRIAFCEKGDALASP